MMILNDPHLICQIPDAAMRALIGQRFAELDDGEPYDPSTHGYFVLVEPGDLVRDIEKAVEWPLLGSMWDDVRFGDDGYVPSFELLEEHQSPACFEMVFVVSDSGCGFIVFVPKVAGIDPALLEFCAAYAVPAVALVG